MPTSYSLVMVGVPCSTSPALAVVPPMSKDRMLSNPRVSPRYADTMTPAAGPDSTMNTGLERAASKVSTPPLLCITSSCPASPASRSRVSMLERYRSTMGRTPALTRVVLARKYSRNSGATSEESETTASGNTSWMISRVRRSCSELR